MTYSVDKVRADFPVLSREVNGLPLAYLDSAASAQKPSQVIDAEAEFYRHGYAAVHRGIHTLSAQATEKMESVRKRASLFINARSAEELVFVRGTTEGINLVANSWGNSNVRAGDNIIISQMEHHANIVPWQMLCVSWRKILVIAGAFCSGIYKPLFYLRSSLSLHHGAYATRNL